MAMSGLIKRLLGRFLVSVGVMLSNFSLLAFAQGQWRSVRERMAVDAKGAPIPWYTYPAIEYLASFDFTDCEVFEYGSGNSSLYWAGRARRVVSVEDDQAWFEAVSRKLLPNQVLLHRADAAGYVGALSEQGRLFDVIVIDGNWRERCVEDASGYLRPGGIIVLDNSDRMIELECGKVLRAQGFIQVDFSGFTPINRYCSTTSMFLKTPDLQQNFRGPSPIGGLKN